MSQTSTRPHDNFVEPASTATKTDDLPCQPAERDEHFQSQDEGLRDLCQALESEECQPATPREDRCSENRSDDLSSKPKRLLDKLLKQLGAWESEILRQREMQRQEQDRLKTRQDELDRRAAELSDQREQLYQKQIEVERTAAAAEAKLATSLQIEGSLRSAQAAAPPGTTPVLAAPAAAPSGQTKLSEADETFPSDASAGLSTAQWLGGLSGNANRPAAHDPPASSAPLALRESASNAGRRSPVSEPEPAPDINPSAEGDDGGDDASVQEYLKSLLSREKQGRLAPNVATSVRSGAPVSRETSPENNPKDSFQDCPIVLPPRAVRKPAPKVDLSAHMPALRDVANHSANSALRHYSQQRLSQRLHLLLLASASVLIIGGSAYWFSETLSLAILGGGVLVSGIAFLGMKILASRYAKQAPIGNGENTENHPESSDDEC